MKKKINIDSIDFENFLDNALKSYGHLFPETDDQMEIYQKTSILKELPLDLQDWSFVFEGKKTIGNKFSELKTGIGETRLCDSTERTIVAGHIINQCNKDDFGRVKFQKLLYLVEHVAQLDLGSSYQRKAAGPHDEVLLKEVELKLRQYNFFKITQDRNHNKRVYYAPLSAATELSSLFSKHFTVEQNVVDSLLAKFRKSTWEQCEIVATLYAVWNNRIINKQEISDSLLEQDFLNWDSNKIKYKGRIKGALDWMRKQNIIPVGWGKIIK